MTELQKYRRLVLGLLLASLTALAVCGYLYLRDQVPDSILVEEGEETPVIFRTSLGAREAGEPRIFRESSCI